MVAPETVGQSPGPDERKAKVPLGIAIQREKGEGADSFLIPTAIAIHLAD